MIWSRGRRRALLFWAALAVGCSGSDGEEGEARDAGSQGDASPDGAADARAADAPPDSALDSDAVATSDLAADPSADLGDAAISAIVAVENPGNSLSYVVSWSTREAVPTDLELACGEASVPADRIEHRYRGSTERRDHRVFVMGLYRDAECSLRARAGAGAGADEATLALTVGRPSGNLAPLEVTEYDPERAQPGWTITTFRTGTDIGQIALVDPLGRYRWYYRSTTNHEAQIVDGGLLVGIDTPGYLDWDGTWRWRGEFWNHHDIRLSPWLDDGLLYLGADDACPEDERGTVEEYDRERDEVVWTWRICDHVTPRLDYPGWGHLNTVEPVPGERAVLVSSRNQDHIYRVDRDSGEITWTLGYGGDFELGEGAEFRRQHAPEVLPDGHILIFDNGLSVNEAQRQGEPFERVRTFTRAIELELHFDDEGAPERAELVWEYSDRGAFTELRGEADRLANGNTLLTYGNVEQLGRVGMVREVTAEGDVVWELRGPREWPSYRSERVAPYYGHVLGE